MRAGRGALLVVALAVGGCTADRTDAGPPPTLAPVSTTDPVYAGIPAGSDVIGGPTVDVVVLDPGAEPRRELRLDPQVGSVTQVTTVVEQGLTVEVNGAVQSIPPMAMEMDLTYTVDTVADEAIAYVVRYDDARVGEGTDRAVAAEIEAVLASVVGAETRVVIDRRGTVLDNDIDQVLPAFASEELGGQATLSVPLPEEAVGVGARWEARSSVSSSGMQFNVNAVYEITELDDDRVVTDVALRLTMPSGLQTIAGQSVRVDGGEILGDGRTTWEFSRPVPVGTQNASGSVGMSMTSGGQRAEMSLTLRQRFEQFLR